MKDDDDDDDDNGDSVQFTAIQFNSIHLGSCLLTCRAHSQVANCINGASC